MGKKRGAQLPDHEARIGALDEAARAFAVVYAIPRITSGDGDNT